MLIVANLKTQMEKESKEFSQTSNKIVLPPISSLNAGINPQSCDPAEASSIPNSCNRKLPNRLENLMNHELDIPISPPAIPKELLEEEEQHIEVETLSTFLQWTKEQTLSKIAELQRTLKHCTEDIDRVEKLKNVMPPLPSKDKSLLRKRSHTELNELTSYATSLRERKKQMLESHLPSLQKSYSEAHVKHTGSTALQIFSNNVTRFTSYTYLQCTKSFRISDSPSPNQVTSAIDFSGSGDLFAIAGDRTIRILNYEDILRNKNSVCSPKKEIHSNSRVADISFNSYFQSKLASCEQNGTVRLWNVEDGTSPLSWKEHTKRVWSVRFSPSNPSLLSSSSDDGMVKVWCINQKQSISTIRNKSSVCAVQFNPYISDQIAFGSSDHNIYYYDLRFPNAPLMILRGHKKAVSNLCFLSKDEIVSSSIDNTLKLWDISKSDVDSMCERTYTGHVNEKNFVGLSTTGSYISCGSEDNTVVTYHKEFSQPAVQFKFKTQGTIPPFVCSLAWRPRRNGMIAANNYGDLAVLRLA